MANTANLKPFTSDQSHDEAVKNGRKGGRKSGKVRRDRRRFRDELAFILRQDAGDGESYNHLVALAIVEKALAGNVEAFKVIRDTVDGKPTEDNRLEIVKHDFSALEAAFEGMKLDYD